MSKKMLFRPPPTAGDDDDDDDDEEEEEEEVEEDEDDDDDDDDEEGENDDKAPSNGKDRPAANEDDDDDDDDDDGDEEEEEDEEDDRDPNEHDGQPSGRKRSRPSAGSSTKAKKKKKSRLAASAFFDIEAEASSDDEDDDEEGEGGGGRKKNSSKKNKEDEGLDREALELIRQQDRRRAQAGRFGERSVVDVVTDIEQRHKLMQSRVVGGRLVPQVQPMPPPRRMMMPPPSTATKGRPSSGGGASSGSGRRGLEDDDDNEDIEEDDGVGSYATRSERGGGGYGIGMAASASSVAVGDAYAAVAQQSLMPSVSDPSLWMVSCANGKEGELVLQIMNKCVAHARQNRPLGISAAIAGQSKGKIYIESYTEPAVLEAIQNVRGILYNTMRLVPIHDMTTVMTVSTTKKPVKKNDWVRMTRGHYKGDLAIVKMVKESGLKCVVQCVPRLDYALADLSPEEARLRRRTVRPPQKFFHAQEVAALGHQSLRRQRFPGLDLYCDYFEGNYYHDGYLLKEMTVGSMVKPITEDDPPTLDELTRFQRRRSANNKGGGGKDDGYRDGDDDGEDDDASGISGRRRGNDNNDDAEFENEGSRMAASLLDELSELQGRTSLGAAASSSGAAGAGLIIGDTVEVIEGDLVGMQGKIMSLDDTTVKIRPLSVDLGGMDEVEFLASQVRKHIPVGAHIKVIDGRYANETGVVVAVEQMEGDVADFTAVVLTDVTSKEISVRISQLRESAEVASGQDKLQGYELYDLVVLSGGGSANEVGVIVRVGQEDFTVVNNHGIAREVRPEELRGKRNSTSSRAVALDVSGNQMRCGDTVNVAEGPHKGKTATIKRMSRAQLFLHSQTRTEHAGIFVVRSRSCLLAGSRNQSRGAVPDGGVSPFATPQSQTRGSGAAAARGKRDDGLVGKTVRVQAGQWKGYLGTVTDSTATHVQVELHSRLKKVMVVRERVAVVGDKFGATEQHDPGTAPANPMTMMMAMATPMHVAMGGATPALHTYGGATPMHDPDNSDDVWRPGGSIDQENMKEDGWGTSPSETSTAVAAAAAASTGNSKKYLSKDDDDDDDDDDDVGTSTGGHGWGTTAEGSEWGAPPPPVVKKDDPTAKADPEGSNSNGGSSAARAGVGPALNKRESFAKVGGGEVVHDVGEDTPAWFMERVYVQVKSGGASGVIREINHDKSASIELEGGGGNITSRFVELSMIPPKEHDTVLVTGGNEIGLEGSLVCIDGSDAIVKDAHDEFKIIDFIHLVKIAES